jgi:hypothetical protein
LLLLLLLDQLLPFAFGSTAATPPLGIIFGFGSASSLFGIMRFGAMSVRSSHRCFLRVSTLAASSAILFAILILTSRSTESLTTIFADGGIIKITTTNNIFRILFQGHGEFFSPIKRSIPTMPKVV